ncbi:unnamed protein product [Vitrella brassicaformis CCMP3155]|uniref:Uncharacterized protein n=1 Tax=Vitrella brassicaformis (strain CCMP3155) TaxID=1169540 RepID=A0A0G4G096_VITBC|nr:unnamed protein product [Vitrella brassicaformis CCMP3155]|eukprot:CEM21287.1 unnamed protein product [Vitrella brassicaformis CCMP3155]
MSSSLPKPRRCPLGCLPSNSDGKRKPSLMTCLPKCGSSSRGQPTNDVEEEASPSVQDARHVPKEDGQGDPPSRGQEEGSDASGDVVSKEESQIHDSPAKQELPPTEGDEEPSWSPPLPFNPSVVSMERPAVGLTPVGAGTEVCAGGALLCEMPSERDEGDGGAASLSASNTGAEEQSAEALETQPMQLVLVSDMQPAMAMDHQEASRQLPWAGLARPAGAQRPYEQFWHNPTCDPTWPSDCTDPVSCFLQAELSIIIAFNNFDKARMTRAKDLLGMSLQLAEQWKLACRRHWWLGIAQR